MNLKDLKNLRKNKMPKTTLTLKLPNNIDLKVTSSMDKETILALFKNTKRLLKETQLMPNYTLTRLLL